jgi:hypothetical protein
MKAYCAEGESLRPGHLHYENLFHVVYLTNLSSEYSSDDKSSNHRMAVDREFEMKLEEEAVA